MKLRSPRLAARAVIVHKDRLLLVNAYPGDQSDLWCAPGGGVEIGQSLPHTLIREVHEETGLAVTVGHPCLVNEFHAPERGFHQVELFFRCSVRDPGLDPAWRDPDGVVHQRRWVTRGDFHALRVKPDSLESVAFDGGEIRYDALERIVG